MITQFHVQPIRVFFMWQTDKMPPDWRAGKEMDHSPPISITTGAAKSGILRHINIRPLINYDDST